MGAWNWLMYPTQLSGVPRLKVALSVRLPQHGRARPNSVVLCSIRSFLMAKSWGIPCWLEPGAKAFGPEFHAPPFRPLS